MEEGRTKEKKQKKEMPSETEILCRFLTRTKNHLRLLIEWKLQMRKMIQVEMENESGN